MRKISYLFILLLGSLIIVAPFAPNSQPQDSSRNMGMNFIDIAQKVGLYFNALSLNIIYLTFNFSVKTMISTQY